MTRIQVDYGRCEGHAICEGIAPELFRVDDDEEQVRVLVETIDPAARAKADEAVLRCPKQALQVVED